MFYLILLAGGLSYFALRHNMPYQFDVVLGERVRNFIASTTLPVFKLKARPRPPRPFPAHRRRQTPPLSERNSTQQCDDELASLSAVNASLAVTSTTTASSGPVITTYPSTPETFFSIAASPMSSSLGRLFRSSIPRHPFEAPLAIFIFIVGLWAGYLFARIIARFILSLLSPLLLSPSSSPSRRSRSRGAKARKSSKNSEASSLHDSPLRYLFYPYAVDKIYGPEEIFGDTSLLVEQDPAALPFHNLQHQLVSAYVHATNGNPSS